MDSWLYWLARIFIPLTGRFLYSITSAFDLAVLCDFVPPLMSRHTLANVRKRGLAEASVFSEPSCRASPSARTADHQSGQHMLKPDPALAQACGGFSLYTLLTCVCRRKACFVRCCAWGRCCVTFKLEQTSMLQIRTTLLLKSREEP